MTKRSPRILYYDLETAPLEGFAWKLWETNIIEVIAPFYILSFSMKWHGEMEIKTFALPDYPLYKKQKNNDKALVKELWKVFNEADIIIAHNGDKFDQKKSNARFILNGLPPSSPYKSIDTLKIARRHFAFESNRLDSLAHALGIGRKLAHSGKQTWLGCMKGEPKAWETMRRYNEQDVNLLEKVYEKLRPWHSTHPDLTIYDERPGCPCCQSAKVQKRGFRVALKKKRQALHCQDCGHWFSGEIIK